MRIEKLKEEDIGGYRKLVKIIIQNSPYETDRSKNEEVRKFSKDYLLMGLRDKGRIYLIGKMKKKKVAFCSAFSYGGGLFWLEWIGVNKDLRRRGIAGQMLRSLEKRLKRKRIHKILTITRVKNKESIKMLQGEGWKRRALLPHYWNKATFFLWEKEIE